MYAPHINQVYNVTFLLSLLHTSVDSALPCWTASISTTKIYIFLYNPNIWSHRQSNTKWHFLLLQAALLACFLSNTFPFFLLRLHWTDVSSTNYIQKLKGDCIEVTFTEGTVIIGSMFCLVIFNFTGFFFLSFRGYVALDAQCQNVPLRQRVLSAYLLSLTAEASQGCWRVCEGVIPL